MLTRKVNRNHQGIWYESIVYENWFIMEVVKWLSKPYTFTLIIKGNNYSTRVQQCSATYRVIYFCGEICNTFDMRQLQVWMGTTFSSEFQKFLCDNKTVHNTRQINIDLLHYLFLYITWCNCIVRKSFTCFMDDLFDIGV